MNQVAKKDGSELQGTITVLTEELKQERSKVLALEAMQREDKDSSESKVSESTKKVPLFYFHK